MSYYFFYFRFSAALVAREFSTKSVVPVATAALVVPIRP